MSPAQGFGHGVVHLGRCGSQLPTDAFGGGLKLREVVGALVEGVASLFRRQQNSAARRQGDAARILGGHPPGAIEGKHRPRRTRQAGERLDLGFRYRFATQ